MMNVEDMQLFLLRYIFSYLIYQSVKLSEHCRSFGRGSGHEPADPGPAGEPTGQAATCRKFGTGHVRCQEAYQGPVSLLKAMACRVFPK